MTTYAISTATSALCWVVAQGCAVIPHGGVTSVDELEGCLQRARTELAASGPELKWMRVELDDLAKEDACRPMDPDAPFSAFEGRWSGQWGDLQVEHIWRTIAPGVQLVLIQDGGVYKAGINLRDGGQICGIVVETGGRERLHAGRFVAGSSVDEAHLEWRAGRHMYRERITCVEGRRHYEILEWVRHQDGYEPGVRTQYAAPMAVPVHLAGDPQ